MASVPNPPAPISAIDAIAPAFRMARQELLQPFRFGFWARMAVVSFFAGEVTGGGISIPNIPQHSGRSGSHWLPVAAFDPSTLLKLLPWIFAIAVASVLMFLLFLYVHSVCRFILFDSVLTGRCSLRQGWGRWHQPGTRYFVWLIFFELIMLLLIAVFIGLPIFAWWRAGIFENPSQHLGLLIGGGLALFMGFLAGMLIALLIAVMVKDFLVPIMALSNATLGQAWDRFKVILLAEKGPFAGYIGMKILLAMAVGVVFALIDFLLILMFVVPIILAMVVLGITLPAAGPAGPAVLALAIMAGLVLFAILLALIAFISVPASIFFQSYTLYFFGSRYGPLGRLLWPAPAEAAPAPPTVTGPEAPASFPPPEDSGPPPLPSPA
jgi:hypothetical protein